MRANWWSNNRHRSNFYQKTLQVFNILLSIFLFAQLRWPWLFVYVQKFPCRPGITIFGLLWATPIQNGISCGVPWLKPAQSCWQYEVESVCSQSLEVFWHHIWVTVIPPCLLFSSSSALWLSDTLLLRPSSSTTPSFLLYNLLTTTTPARPQPFYETGSMAAGALSSLRWFVFRWYYL